MRCIEETIAVVNVYDKPATLDDLEANIQSQHYWRNKVDYNGKCGQKLDRPADLISKTQSR